MTSGVPLPMDAEPGRCRRTDGQKWRCRLAVLPDKKYCERHVNRGRNRSRKHVETDQNGLKSKPTAKTNAVKQTKVGIKDQSFKIKKHSKEPHEISLLPESVVPHDKVPSCETSSKIPNTTLAVVESPRCKRSDGKKWQCNKSPIPDQKYCMQHMHRGTKKAEDSEKSNANGVGAGFEQNGEDETVSIDFSSSSDDNGDDDPNGAVSH